MAGADLDSHTTVATPFDETATWASSSSSSNLSGDDFNGIEKDADSKMHVASVYIQFVLIVTLHVFCVLGNVLLIACVWQHRALHTINNALILNLAITDLQVAIFVLPIWSATTLHQDLILPDGVCIAIAMVTFLLFLESMSTLGVIALDRYINICHPLRYATLVTEQRVGIGVAYTWVQSVILAVLPLGGFGKYGFTTSKLTICSVDFADDTRYSILVIMLTILPSCVTIMVCYFKIFKVARMQFRKVHQMALATVGAGLRKSRQSIRPIIARGNTVAPQGRLHGNGGRRIHDNGVQCSNDVSSVDSNSSSENVNNPGLQDTGSGRSRVFKFQNGGDTGSGSLRTMAITEQERPRRRANSVGETSDTRQGTVFQQQQQQQQPQQQHHLSPVSPNRPSDFKIVPVTINVPETGLWFKASKVVRNSIRQIRAFRTVFTIIGCFLACWTPYIILMLHTVRTRETPNYTLDFIVTFLAFLNSIANPVICVTINRDFRNAFIRFLKLVCPPWRRQQLIREVVEAFATAAATSDNRRERTNRSGSGTSSSIISEGTLLELRRLYF